MWYNTEGSEVYIFSPCCLFSGILPPVPPNIYSTCKSPSFLMAICVVVECTYPFKAGEAVHRIA